MFVAAVSCFRKEVGVTIQGSRRPSHRLISNNVGIQTNCMSCHGNANYAPDFLWSLPAHAK